MRVYFTTLLLGASLGCGSAATSAPSTSPATSSNGKESPAVDPAPAVSPAASDSGEELAPLAPLPFAEAKKRADDAWRSADNQKSSASAWDRAAEALALAAQAKADDASVAGPLLRGAMAAWRNSDKLQPAKVKKAGSHKRARRALPRRETMRIAVLEQLAASTDPSSTELATIEYRHGRILWKHNHFKEAAEHFRLVVTSFPSSREAKFASPLVLDSLLQSGDFAHLDKEARLMLKNKALVSAYPELVETLQMVRHQSGKSDARR